MKALILESNLMWSARLAKSFAALGHETVVSGALPSANDGYDLAVVNLGTPDATAQIAGLQEWGVRVIAHAGHKETELMDLGRVAGVDQLVTNSMLTWKLPEILAKNPSPGP